MFRSRRPLGVPGCVNCLAAPSLPGEARPFPTWAGVTIGVGLIGTAILVAVTMLQARR